MRGETMEAIFIGQHGSLGYEHGKTYSLKVNHALAGGEISVEPLTAGNEERCVYASERAFRKNWYLRRELQYPTKRHRIAAWTLGEGQEYPEITGFIMLEDKILVKPDEVETKTKSGLIIPETAEQERAKRGTVLAVGKGYEDKHLTVEVGSRVVYGKYAGSNIELDGQELLLMREVDLFGIL